MKHSCMKIMGAEQLRMSVEQFDPGNLEPDKLRIEVSLLRQRLVYREETVSQKQKELDRLYNDLNQSRTALTTQVEQNTRLRIDLEKNKVERKEQNQKTWRKRILALFISLFFGASTLLFNYGNSLLTNKPPDPGASYVLIIAAVIYFGCVSVSILVLGGDN